MTRKPHVALDIDGVLFNWDEAAATALEEHFGYENLTRDPDQWNALKRQVDKEHWGWLFTEAGSDATLRGDSAYPGVREGLVELGKIATVTFITHRPAVSAAATAEWIARHGCQFESLHVIGRNGSDRIPKWAIQPEADLYVEDRSDNVAELLYNTKYATVLVPQCSYNADLWDRSRDDYRADPSWGQRLMFYDVQAFGFAAVVNTVRYWELTRE